jgi:signal transduction histidine kinase
MDRTKMRFIQVSAHELRTPLTIIQGYAQLTKLRTAGMEDVAPLTTAILDGSKRMAEIIDSMLDVSRIDNNTLEVIPCEVEISPVIEQVEEVFECALEERRLNFKTEGLTDLPTIHADKDLLYKTFYQVIGNAIKYTPDGGRITVTGQTIEDACAGSEIEIRVQDTGIGIDPHFQELVFEKFYQTGEVLLHSSSKTKFKGGGPGLGLAIARGIVNAHHGRIWLKSPGHNEELNPGTTVYVRLPLNGFVHESN